MISEFEAIVKVGVKESYSSCLDSQKQCIFLQTLKLSLKSKNSIGRRINTEASTLKKKTKCKRYKTKNDNTIWQL